jgi:hypothetical protein
VDDAVEGFSPIAPDHSPQLEIPKFDVKSRPWQDPSTIHSPDEEDERDRSVRSIDPRTLARRHTHLNLAAVAAFSI